MKTLYQSTLNLPLINRGKVRDIYQIGQDKLLIVTTDRISAFDVILAEPIDHKGEVLTAVSNFWFDKTQHIVSNHLLDEPLDKILSADELAQVQSRAIAVARVKPVLVEAIVRGYLIGSGWQDYQKTGEVCGIKLPDGLQLAQQLPEPIYTPSTKAQIGDKDENITFDDTVSLIGEELANRIKEISLNLYQFAAQYALNKGIIIADTKFEFGLDDEGKLMLIDEVLTPDSSRFWSSEEYQLGTSPASYDKQIVRDYLLQCDWDKNPPAPNLPQAIIERTAQRYQSLQQILCN